MSLPELSTNSRNIYRFGSFELSVDRHTLTHHGVAVHIQDLPFQMLLLLLEKKGEIATKDELRDRLWGDKTFVEVDQNLYVIVARLRELLGDNAVRPQFIKTVSGRGYRFIGTVTLANSSDLRSLKNEASASEAFSPDVAPTEDQPAVDVKRVDDVESPQHLSSTPSDTGKARKITLAVTLAGILLACVIGIAIYISSKARIYSPQQQILVGGLENDTKKSDLDATLAFLIQLKLQESPYLSLISDQRSSPMRRESAFSSREGQLRSCAALDGKLLINGRLVPNANGFRVQLMAFRCPDGKLLTTQQADADSEASLLTAIDLVTERMRQRLGEPADSLQRFNMPLTQSTTTSLAALKEFTEGEKKLRSGNSLGAVSDYKLAIDLDPRFALGYARLGAIYLNAQEPVTAAQYIQKAFDLRDRTTDKERLYITAHYYTDVTGELQRSIETYNLWTSLYPGDWGPLNNLTNLYDLIGRPDKGLEFARMAIHANPEASTATATLAQAYMEHGDYSPLAEVCRHPSGQNNSSVNFHNICYLGAFARDSVPDMQQELQWAHGNPEESLLLGSVAYGELSHGQKHASDRLFSEAQANALTNKMPEMAAELELNQAIAAAELGDSMAAVQHVHHALPLTARNNEALGYAAVALALADAEAPALQSMGQAVQQAPANDVVVRLEQPTVRAVLALRKHHPSEAVEALQISSPLLMYEPMKFVPAYYLGKAYLENGQLDQAAASFEHILQNRAVSPDSIYVGLTALALGRTLALKSDELGAARAYDVAAQIWKNADPDFLPLKELKQRRRLLNQTR